MTSRRFTVPTTPRGLCVLYSEDTMVLSFELPADETRARLTLAELDVLTDLIEGCANAEIARRRGRSARTVANQVASILRKLGLLSRLEVVAGSALSRG